MKENRKRIDAQVVFPFNTHHKMHREPYIQIGLELYNTSQRTCVTWLHKGAYGWSHKMARDLSLRKKNMPKTPSCQSSMKWQLCIRYLCSFGCKCTGIVIERLNRIFTLLYMLPLIGVRDFRHRHSLRLRKTENILHLQVVAIIENTFAGIT